MDSKVFDHRSGLLVIDSNLIEGIKQIILRRDPSFERNTVSKIKNEILNDLYREGWSKECRLDSLSKITITSCFEGIGLCLQTGNVGRIYADLLKLQALFTSGRIKAGIIILPLKASAQKLASNMANFERLISELRIFKQVITIPIVVIGFGVTER